jgi:hypothetical protein
MAKLLKLMSEGLRKKHAVESEFWAQSQHLVEDPGRPRKSLLRVGQPQDLPDAYRLVSSSPDFKYTNPTDVLAY